MKQFRKNQEAHFICEECGRVCKDKTALVNHNRNTHKISRDEYFDKWIKEEGDDICVICGNKTKLIRTDIGYKTTCSIKCQNIYATNQTKKANIEKYGVENPYQRKDIIEKCKKTKLKKYGNEKYQNREQINKTNLERYGSNNLWKTTHVQNKIKETNLKLYGVEYNWQRKDVKHKIKKVCLEKYGVEHPMHNTEIFERQLKKRRLIKKFRDADLLYQGSYELDFLEKFYDKIDIENGPSVPYLFEGKNKVYHSDFYVPSLNLVVEIKSDYILTLDEAIEEKKKAVISNSFNYILILNKDYLEFEKLYL
jgi:hypothetical protein